MPDFIVLHSINYSFLTLSPISWLNRYFYGVVCLCGWVSNRDERFCWYFFNSCGLLQQKNKGSDK